MNYISVKTSFILMFVDIIMCIYKAYTFFIE